MEKDYEWVTKRDTDYYVDSSGKVVGEVYRLLSGLFSAVANGTRLGNYIHDGAAFAAVEAAVQKEGL